MKRNKRHQSCNVTATRLAKSASRYINAMRPGRNSITKFQLYTHRFKNELKNQHNSAFCHMKECHFPKLYWGSVPSEINVFAVFSDAAQTLVCMRPRHQDKVGVVWKRERNRGWKALIIFPEIIDRWVWQVQHVSPSQKIENVLRMPVDLITQTLSTSQAHWVCVFPHGSKHKGIN